MLHAVDTLEPSLDTSLAELREVVAAAYDHVRLARRYLASISTSADLSARLQFAEAELVRARVALNEIQPSAVIELPRDRSTELNVAPIGRKRGEIHDYGN